MAWRDRRQFSARSDPGSPARTEGAFSMLFLTPNELIAIAIRAAFVRWPWAVWAMPGWLLLKLVAFDLIDAQYVRDVEPGEMLVIDQDGLRSSHPLPVQQPSMCLFEHVYFARPDSLIFGQSVNESRHRMGAQLAIEQPAAADVVVPVPDSGTVAAIGYSAQSGVSFRFGLVRNHYVGRTFIEPRQSIRSFGVRIKLNPVRELIAGKRVVLIDDSIVRGTTSKKIVRMVREAGASEVHMRISCPRRLVPVTTASTRRIKPT